MACFIAVFSLLQWSRTEPTISLRYACTFKLWGKELDANLKNVFFKILLETCKQNSLKTTCRASLVAQWLRVHLPMQGTRVPALVREDLTCHGAAGTLHHSCWACALEPTSHSYRVHTPQLLKPVRLEPVLRSRRGHCNEKPIDTTRESPRAAAKTQCRQK